MENWIVIYSTNKLYEAELVKEIMADNEIECIVMNKQDSAYMFGDIELMVPLADEIRANELILEFKRESE